MKPGVRGSRRWGGWQPRRKFWHRDNRRVQSAYVLASALQCAMQHRLPGFDEILGKMELYSARICDVLGPAHGPWLKCEALLDGGAGCQQRLLLGLSTLASSSR